VRHGLPHSLIRYLRALACCAAFSVAAYAAEPLNHEFGGHLKVRGSYQRYPSDSIIYDYTGANAEDLSTELRLKFSADRGRWDFKTDGQAIYLYGDTIEYTRELAAQSPGFDALFGGLPNDDRRWWNLTDTIENEGKRAAILRADRLSVGYTSPTTALRFGRQAISWGNGLSFAPMDIVNPFDPYQVDVEYKSGDDMFYGQYLFDSGDDVQSAYVVRRNPQTGDVESDQATFAGKYHGSVGIAEFDVLGAQNYGEALLGIGGGRDVGGAVWRSDLVLSDTDDDGVVTQFVLNSSYSWVWAGKNVSGSLEYFFNGFGQHDACYTPACLAANPELLERIARGQLFTLGRNYLAGSLMIEWTPLFTLTPNLFWNLNDSSARLQLVPQYSLGDNLVLLGAVNIPIGPNGTEYGGLETEVPGEYFSTDLAAFVQIGWYF
jgi:hypothetical protein